MDARDQRVFDAVRDLLAVQGMRLSMDAVATQAGCSKQTLYSRYGCKHDLLRRVMQQHVSTATAGLSVEEGSDLRETLLGFAIGYLENKSRPQVLQARQLLLSEARAFPEETQALYRGGAVALHAHIAEWMATAIRQGRLRHDDPHFMAELLLSMIAGLDFERRCFNAPHRGDAASRRRWAEFSIDGFLRAFAPEPATQMTSHTNTQTNTPRSYS